MVSWKEEAVDTAVWTASGPPSYHPRKALGHDSLWPCVLHRPGAQGQSSRECPLSFHTSCYQGTGEIQMCLCVLRLMTKDNKENKATCLGEGVNLQLHEKKGFPWQLQQMKLGTSWEGHLYYLLYAQGAAAATSYLCLPIKINASRHFYLASHVYMGCFSKLHLLPPAAHLLSCQSTHGAAWGHCGTEYQHSNRASGKGWY